MPLISIPPPELIEKSVTENGEYIATADNADGYSSVNVDVSNSYTQADNGKVVNNQELVAQTAYPTEITENDTYDTTNYNSITVNVSGGGGNIVAYFGIHGNDYLYCLEDDDNVIGSSAFSDFDLTSITIPNSVTSIGDNAFNGCASLTSITIPNSVTSIGIYAFENCYALETVTFEANSSLVTIGEDAFVYCSSLTSITIPNSVTSIEEGAFVECSALETVTFEANSSLVTISNTVFSVCSALTSITIPNSVTSIGENVFAFSSALETVTFEPTIPPTLGGDLGIPSTCVIRVPQGTLSDYTSASNYPDPSEYTYEEY